MKIKARRNYTIRTVSGGEEKIRVTGWEAVTVGVKGSDRFPERVESWCRVLTNGGIILMHPDRIAREMVTA